MNKIVAVVILILLAAAYVGGYWPQHRQLRAAQQSAAQAQEELSGAQTVARVCHLENDLLALIGQTENQNYGNARNLSNAFFDEMRREADRDQNTPYKGDLENILGQRDTVTAGLARADASTPTALRQLLAQMQQLMGKLAGPANL
jgi:type II secretory pathway pseudopilin PulG